MTIVLFLLLKCSSLIEVFRHQDQMNAATVKSWSDSRREQKSTQTQGCTLLSL